jgi:dTMP kinase
VAGAFHDRVRAAYLEMAESYPARIAVIDATDPVEAIAADVRKLVEALL